MKSAANTQTFRDLDEHWGVFDIDYFPGWHLGDIQRGPKDRAWALSAAPVFEEAIKGGPFKLVCPLADMIPPFQRLRIAAKRSHPLVSITPPISTNSAVILVGLLIRFSSKKLHP